MSLSSVQAVYKWYRSAKGCSDACCIPSIDNLVLISDMVDATLEEILVLKTYDEVEKDERKG